MSTVDFKYAIDLPAIGSGEGSQGLGQGLGHEDATPLNGVDSTACNSGDVPIKAGTSSLVKKIALAVLFVALAVGGIVLAIELLKHHQSGGDGGVQANGLDGQTNNPPAGGAALIVANGSSSSSSSSSSTSSASAASGTGGTGVSSSSMAATGTSSSIGTVSGSSTSSSSYPSSSTAGSASSSTAVSSSSSSSSHPSLPSSSGSASSSTPSATSSSSSAVSSTTVPSSSAVSSSSTGGAPSSSVGGSSSPVSSSAAASSSAVSSSSTGGAAASSSTAPSSSAASSSTGAAGSSSSTGSHFSSSSSTGVPSSSSVVSSSSTGGAAGSSSSSSTAASSSSSNTSTPASSSSAPVSSSTVASSSAVASSTAVPSSSAVSSSSTGGAASSSSTAAAGGSSSSSTGSHSSTSSSSSGPSSSSAPSPSSTGTPSSSTGGASSSSSGAPASSSSSTGSASSSSSSTGTPSQPSFAVPLLVNSLVGTNMTLQRGESRLWGSATKGYHVTAQVLCAPGIPIGLDGSNSVTNTTLVNPSNGVWVLSLFTNSTVQQAFNCTITLKDDLPIPYVRTFTNVAFGDVYMCSGQSNMRLSVNMVHNNASEMADAINYPQMRVFNVHNSPTTVIQTNVTSQVSYQWAVMSPDILAPSFGWDSFSAICYFFGRSLYNQTLNGSVPLGLIENVFGGTNIEGWMSPTALSQCGLAPQVPIPSPANMYLYWTTVWLSQIAPILPLRVTAVLWYQGENNAADSPQNYSCTLPAMIRDWRQQFGAPKLPFFVMQLPGIDLVQPTWGTFRVVQDLAVQAIQAETNAAGTGAITALASVFDSSQWADPANTDWPIHPKFGKQTGGLRLANLARAYIYNTPGAQDLLMPKPLGGVIYPGATSSNVTVQLQFPLQPNSMSFSFAGTPFCDQTHNTPAVCCTISPFEVGTNNNQWVRITQTAILPATQTTNASVWLNVTAPVGMGPFTQLRYSIEAFAHCALYNSLQQPVTPFIFNLTNATTPLPYSSSSTGSPSSSSTGSGAPASSSSSTGATASGSSTGGSYAAPSTLPDLSKPRPPSVWYLNANSSLSYSAPLSFVSIRTTNLPNHNFLSGYVTTPYTTDLLQVNAYFQPGLATGSGADFYLMSNQPHTLPGMQQDSNYTFSFDLQPTPKSYLYGCSNGEIRFLVYRRSTNTNVMSATPRPYAETMPTSIDWKAWNVTNNRSEGLGTTGSIVAQFPVPCLNFTHSVSGIPVTQTGGWMSMSVNFTMPFDVADTVIGLYFGPSGVVTNYGGGSYETWGFRNFSMKLVPGQLQRPPTLPLQTGATVLATLRKQSTVADYSSNTSTTACPHLWPNLTPWESIISIVNETQPVIILPDFTQILYSINSNPRAVWWQKIVIPITTTLIFDDVPLEVHFENIVVLGALRIGSSTCRLLSTQNYYIHNNSTAPPPTGSFTPPCYTCPGMLSTIHGSKGIAAPAPNSAFPLNTSVIELHAYQYTPTWTRLAATIFPGDIFIYVQDSNNWEVGQTIGLVTSTYYDEIKQQNEETRIVSISSDGTLIEIFPPARFHHYAGPEYQSEVGLLSRRIRFQGYDGDGSASLMRVGGHIMSTGQLRASGIELTRMGQRNVLGRYPLHWHMAGDANQYASQGGQVIQDCSFHHTFFRCLSIHATHYASVTRSVGFDIIGHCFFIEDGCEENNTLSYNLGASVHAILPLNPGVITSYGTGSTPLLWHNVDQPKGDFPLMGGVGQTGVQIGYGSGLVHASDAAPAAFYITNAYNRLYGNAASGGFTGFSFIGLGATTGSSWGKYPTTVPKNRPSLEFDGNTAHSSGYTWEEGGGCLYAGGDLQYNNNTNDFYYDSQPYTMIQPAPGYVTRVYLMSVQLSTNSQRLWSTGGGVNSVAINTEFTDVAFAYNLFYGRVWHARIDAHSNNPSYKQREQHVFIFYDTFAYLMASNITVIDFLNSSHTDFPAGWTFSSLQLQPSYVTQPIVALQKVAFINCDNDRTVSGPDISLHLNVLGYMSDYTFTMEDFDGSTANQALNTYKANNNNSKIQTINISPTTLNTRDDYWPLGKPAIIAVANNYTSFWHLDGDCILSDLWRMYICAQTFKRMPMWLQWDTRLTGQSTGLTPIQYYDRLGEPGVYHPDPIWGSVLGQVYLFGPNLTLPDRVQPIFNVHYALGVTGMGWWVNHSTLGGSPSTFNVQPSMMMNHTYFIMALPYPANTNFTVQWKWGDWWADGGSYRNVPAVQNYTQLVKSTGPAWYFDSTDLNFYIRMISCPGDYGSGVATYDLDGMSLPGGALIYGVSKNVWYQWNTTCTGMTGQGVCPVNQPTYPIRDTI